VGHGSEFIITLPLAAGVTAPLVSATESSTNLHSLKVLVVDDNHDAADSMAMLVEQSGALVRVAYSALDALRIVDEFMPRVVLLDIGMPGMDGYEACRRLRALHGDKLAVVAVSGWGQDSDKQLAQRAGFDAHLTKPADPIALAETVARFRHAR
jgi:CheY-like chemotaxis protein